MLNKKVIGFVAGTMFIALGLGATCVPMQGTGTLRVSITDKPFPFDMIASAEVTVTEVKINADTEEDSEESSWITVWQQGEGEEPKTFDLLTLQNGQTGLLGEAEVPAGTYNQMRLIIDGGTVTLNDAESTEFDLTVPSGETSGIKLHFAFAVETDGVTELLLDFDLSRAFKVIPGSAVDSVDEITNITFAPSLQDVLRVVDTSEVGEISGTVTDAADSEPIAGAAVTAYDDIDTEVTTTATDDNGMYVLSGLEPGTYSVEFSATGYEDSNVADVAVTADETTEDVDAALTAATMETASN